MNIIHTRVKNVFVRHYQRLKKFRLGNTKSVYIKKKKYKHNSTVWGHNTF